MKVILFILLVVVVLAVVQCVTDKGARERWLIYPQQVGIGLDQFINALIPPFGALSFADETLSARIWRAYRDGRWMGRILMPPVNVCFRWQGFPNHCERAYQKEIERRSLPPEYRTAEATPARDA